MKKTLTLKELKKMRACLPSVRRFGRFFGKQAKIWQIVAGLHKLDRKNWEARLLG